MVRTADSHGTPKMRADRLLIRASAVTMLTLLITSCGHMPTVRWPWAAKPVPAPERADELFVTQGQGNTEAAYPQYWKRNTLVLDLQGAPSSGVVTLQPRTGTQWPVRVALRVMPGQVGTLEVRGDQRMILPITVEGSKPIDLELTPGIYTAKTPHIVVSWGADAGCCVYSTTN